ncbi:excisionase family DNA-binding protein [Phascolarctobacterium faecium]|nr:excisionase family DNA-binding protein [Phascolarctobacterium faecium]MDM8110322.1 excisionase family DNA-binding protein [Phascolarctobacterium faecium]
MKERKFFTVSQLIEYFGNGVISRGTIYLMVKKGEIPTVRIGERILIPATWVEQFMLNAAKVVAAKTTAAKA